MERVYKNVELLPNEAEQMKKYLRELAVKFESSAAGEYVHFEILVNEQEAKETNEFLSKL